MPEVSSRVPACTMTMPLKASASPILDTVTPQLPQNEYVNIIPLSCLVAYVLGDPLVTLNLVSGTRTLVVYALPVRRWQVKQWQIAWGVSTNKSIYASTYRLQWLTTVLIPHLAAHATSGRHGFRGMLYFDQ